MFPILELISSQRHSRYFKQTRSHFIYRRVRLLSLILALLQTAWIFVDHLLLPEEVWWAVAVTRMISSAAFLGLFFWAQRPYNTDLALLRLLLLFLFLSCFHATSTAFLILHQVDQAVAGYEFFPFMIITMLAIFPLTLLEVAGITLLMLTIELGSQLLRGQWGELTALNNLWLLGVLALIAGWAAVNQMNMLLGLYRQATRDALTGLANRRLVLEQLDADIQSCREESQPLSVLLFDLDKFKGFNDKYGHAAGDIVLKEFAAILKQQARKKLDLPGRFGGEEFLLILPGQDEQAAIEMAQQIGQACRDSLVWIPGNLQVSFTTSIGIAGLRLGENSSDLIRRADEALYAAKAAGRDGWVVAQ
ncbi:GGDEF domain-containing protein [Nitrincola tapanii]|uniref:diguanylate cyclase n=1 Tax=Nitrincola tapanii TaxID=1708751 RepID=A0A5A9WA46_9GAMM|nr:GGDEF domain-containing protein [Nitrincola tapanii]KAA0876291.1 GGDEF domain-containing protein [Nitrincola tapanii]